MSLRTDLIEAGAKGMVGKGGLQNRAEGALDAMLDLLTERADELVRLADPSVASPVVIEARQVVIEQALAAVLRNPGSQP